MKKNIKADRERKILKEEFLNDNALFQVSMEDNRDILVTIRFVESSRRTIKETILTKMDIYEYMSDYDNLVKISKDFSAIAIFNQKESALQLDRLYDVEKQEFALDEFIDIIFKKKFLELTLDKHLVLKNTN